MSVLKPRTTSVTLYHGDDLERLADLNRAARVAAARAEAAARKAEIAERKAEVSEDAPAAPLRGGDPVDASARELREALAEQEAAEAEQEAAEAAYDEAVTQAAERAVEIRLNAIGSTRFSDLLLAHPARTELDDDGKPQVHEDDLAFSRAQEIAGYRPVLVNVATFPKALLSQREGRQTIVEPKLSEEQLREFLDDECAEGDIERMWTTAFFLNRGMADPKAMSRSSTSSLS